MNDNLADGSQKFLLLQNIPVCVDLHGARGVRKTRIRGQSKNKLANSVFFIEFIMFFRFSSDRFFVRFVDKGTLDNMAKAPQSNHLLLLIYDSNN